MKVRTSSSLVSSTSNLISRCGGIGRHKGLKIPRWRQRTGSTPVSGTICVTSSVGSSTALLRRVSRVRVPGDAPRTPTSLKASALEVGDSFSQIPKKV